MRIWIIFFNMRKLIFCSLDPDTGAKIRGIFRIRILSTGLLSLILINIYFKKILKQLFP